MILIACPSCERQYDVSRVPVGNRVRCLCDEVITVGTQKSLQVRALHCSHCGGAVEATEENCRWCEARLSDQDRKRSTLCPKCFKRIEEDSNHCNSCGVAITPQALTPLPADRACPRCKGELQIRALGVADVVECSVCHGIWLSVRVFEAVCRDAERELESFLIAKPNEAQPAKPNPAHMRYIPCFDCEELMNRRNFRHGVKGSGVVVDYCRGHGVWLDHQELEQIVEFIRTRGAGPLAGQGVRPYLEPPVDVGKAKRRGRISEGRRSRSGGSDMNGAYWVGEAVVELLATIGSAILH